MTAHRTALDPHTDGDEIIMRECEVEFKIHSFHLERSGVKETSVCVCVCALKLRLRIITECYSSASVLLESYLQKPVCN